MNKLAWLGTATSIAGAFIVAFKFFLLGYSLFVVGAVSWLIVGTVRKDKPLVILNGTFLIANIIGLYNAIWNI